MYFFCIWERKILLKKNPLCGRMFFRGACDDITNHDRKLHYIWVYCMTGGEIIVTMQSIAVEAI